jgi:hypothetical protein
MPQELVGALNELVGKTEASELSSLTSPPDFSEKGKKVQTTKLPNSLVAFPYTGCAKGGSGLVREWRKHTVQMRGVAGQGSTQGKESEQELTISQVLECLLPTVEWHPVNPGKKGPCQDEKVKEQSPVIPKDKELDASAIGDVASPSSLFAFSIPEKEREVRVVAFLNGQEIKVRITDE